MKRESSVMCLTCEPFQQHEKMIPPLQTYCENDILLYPSFVHFVPKKSGRSSERLLNKELNNRVIDRHRTVGGVGRLLLRSSSDRAQQRAKYRASSHSRNKQVLWANAPQRCHFSRSIDFSTVLLPPEIHRTRLLCVR